MKDMYELIFNMEMPLLAHDSKEDPLICFANQQALKLWDLKWEEMIGMPSRLTAPMKERENRKSVLKYVMKQKAIEGYQGIRINSRGDKFLINNASIWTIWNQQGSILGQAAIVKEWISI